MKKRSFVFIIILAALSWYGLIKTEVDAGEELYKSNCRVNPEAERNVIIDDNGERLYHNVDQKVLWDLANDFCVSLDLLVAYNFILVPREPVQYTYIKLPPAAEELDWFPGQSLNPSSHLLGYSDSLNFQPTDPLGPEQLPSIATKLDPFFITDQQIQFSWPISLNDGVVSQLYHRNHHGVDIAIPIGTPVHSMANGWVIRAEEEHHIFGKLLVIDHGDDLMGVYGHLSQLNVEEGDFVWQGERIAHSGNSGRSTAPHLHLEIRKLFRYTDPCEYLPNCPTFAFHGPRPTEEPDPQDELTESPAKPAGSLPSQAVDPLNNSQKNPNSLVVPTPEPEPEE